VSLPHPSLLQQQGGPLPLRLSLCVTVRRTACTVRHTVCTTIPAYSLPGLPAEPGCCANAYACIDLAVPMFSNAPSAAARLHFTVSADRQCLHGPGPQAGSCAPFLLT
jgi:hypothetical protein